MNRSLWMNNRRWRLEEVDGGLTVVCGGWRRSMVEMNCIPWSPVLRYATPLPMNRTPVSTVALQHKSVSSVLRYATPLPINRTPVSTVGGPFPPFCGTPGPSRSTGPRFELGRSNTRPFPPFCGTPDLVSIACSIQALPMNTTTHSVPTQPVGSP